MAERDDRDGPLRDQLRDELTQEVRAELRGDMRCPTCLAPLSSGGRETLRTELWEWRAQICRVSR